jgi:hypothetical protein
MRATEDIEHLPFIDELSQPVDAPPEAVWEALLGVLRRAMSRGSSATYARLVGCEPLEGTPGFDGRPGDAVPGFRVMEAEPGRRLALRGRHRFSVYAVTFQLDDGHLRATTHAAFPGVKGKLYRAAVISSGAHKIVFGRLLRRIARRAERGMTTRVASSTRKA